MQPALKPLEDEIVFVPETHDMAGDMERLLDRAFGPGRFAKPSERVREFARLDRALSRAALKGGAPAGVCRLYHIGVREAPALFLGPLAVDPGARHAGLGHALVRESLEAARAAGAGAVILMGAPSFFEPLGFARIPEGRIAMPGPAEARRMHWIALRPGALDALAGPITPPPGAS